MFSKNKNILEPIEVMPLDDLKKIQIKLLNKTIRKLKEQSMIYKEKLKKIDKIKNIQDMKKLPIMTKDELRKYNVFDTLVVSKNKIVEYHASSGTTAKPYIMALTKKDIEISKKVLARTWYMHGIRERSVVQMMVSYGLFTAGLLNHYALQFLKASIIPSSVLSTYKQLELIRSLKPDFLVAVSSYYLRLINKIEEFNFDIPSPKGVIGGGKPILLAINQQECCYL